MSETRSSYMYCVGKAMPATRPRKLFERGTGPIARQGKDFSLEEIKASFPADEKTINIYATRADAEAHTAFLDRENYNSENERHAIFKIKIDLAESKSQAIDKSNIELYQVSPGKRQDIVSALIGGDEYALQSATRQKYENIWARHEGKDFLTKFIAMIDFYKTHRDLFGNHIKSRHEDVALAFQHELSTLSTKESEQAKIPSLIRGQLANLTEKEKLDHYGSLLVVAHDGLVAEMHAPKKMQSRIVLV